MSLPPPNLTERDTSEIAAPKDPAAYRPKPLLGATFWAMMVLMLLCVLAGVGIANFGPQLFAPKAAPAKTSTVETPVGEPATATTAPTLPPPAALAPAAAPSADMTRLSARVATLEAQQSHAAQAAAAALAASAVVEASQGTGPFADELSSLRAISPPSPELQALARLAQTGAPSRTALAATYADYAARAASAAREPTGKARIGQRIVYELSRIVTLRRVGDPGGDSVDALLARAERQVDDGDLDRALRTLDRLPAGARDAMAPWRARAERRADIDRNAEALRARALQTLASQARDGA
jgi:hypothetical protein